MRLAKHRDTRPRRRTLAHRPRKRRTFSLTITRRRLFEVSDDGQYLTSQQCGFAVRLHGNLNLRFLDIRSIRLVPVKDYRPHIPLHRRHYCLHVQVAVPEPVPLEELDVPCPEDVLGADRGRKNHVAVSSGHRAHHPGAKKQGKRRRQHRRHLAGKPRNSKRRQHAIAKHRERGRRYTQRRDQEMRRQIRGIPLDAQPKMVAVESLHPISMMASARGTVAAHGKNVKAKRKLNESLAEAAIGHVGPPKADCARKPANSAYLPSPFRRRAGPVPDTGHVPDLPALRRPAPEQPREPSGVPVSELRSLRPPPIGLPPSSFATGLTSDTANGSQAIHRTY